MLTKYLTADILKSGKNYNPLNYGRHLDVVSENVLLNTINDVKKFVNIVCKYDFEVDLTSGRYVIDAKSIMGIFSLDLSKPIKIEARCEKDSKFIEEIKSFVVK